MICAGTRRASASSNVLKPAYRAMEKHMHPVSVKTAGKDLTETEMARRIAVGDQDAFQLLMRRYNQRLYRTARSILKDDAEAEDAVQEAYMLAYRAMGAFRGEAKLDRKSV